MQKTINCALFRKMVLAGAKALENNRAKVDALNVFPVPDGDTGTNMSLTMQSAVKELSSSASSRGPKSRIAPSPFPRRAPSSPSSA